MSHVVSNVVHIISNNTKLGTKLKPFLVFQLLNSDRRSTATVQVCSGSVNLKGAVKCRAYVHSSKPKVKDAVQVQKE